MLPLTVCLVFALEYIALAFHVSVAVCIAHELYKGTLQNSAFFVMYLCQTVVDVADYFVVLYQVRLPYWGVLTPTILEPTGKLIFYMSGIVQFYQCLSHTCIAFNRYTVIVYVRDVTSKHEKIWTKKFLAFVLLLIAAIAAVCSIPRALLDVHTVQNETGYQYVTSDKDLNLITGIISVTLAVTTCLISGILELRSFLAWRRLGSARRRERADDFRLLIYAVMSLVSQLLMAVFWGVCYSVSMYNPYVRNVTKTALPYIVDLLSLSGSFCLLITSRIIRQKYQKFYGLTLRSKSQCQTSNTVNVISLA